jgi:hypothetical protein
MSIPAARKIYSYVLRPGAGAISADNAIDHAAARLRRCQHNDGGARSGKQAGGKGLRSTNPGVLMRTVTLWPVFRRASRQGRRAERLGGDSDGWADLSKIVRAVKFLDGGAVRSLALATISLAEAVAA